MGAGDEIFIGLFIGLLVTKGDSLVVSTRVYGSFELPLLSRKFLNSIYCVPRIVTF